MDFFLWGFLYAPLIASQMKIQLSESKKKKLEVFALVALSLMLGNSEPMICFMLGGDVGNDKIFIENIIKVINYIGLGVLLIAAAKYILYIRSEGKSQEGKEDASYK